MSAGGERPAFSYPPVPAPRATTIYLVDKPGSAQSIFAIGLPGPPRSTPDYYALQVMNTILGGMFQARLNANLREEKGYTYGVYSRFTAVKYPGPWSAGGDLRTEVTEGAMTEFLREINRLRDEKVLPAELEEHKRAIVAGFALSLEQPSTLLGYALTRKIYGLPDDYWETYPTRIMAVTADDVMRVAGAIGDAGQGVAHHLETQRPQPPLRARHHAPVPVRRTTRMPCGSTSASHPASMTAVDSSPATMHGPASLSPAPSSAPRQKAASVAPSGVQMRRVPAGPDPRLGGSGGRRTSGTGPWAWTRNVTSSTGSPGTSHPNRFRCSAANRWASSASGSSGPAETGTSCHCPLYRQSMILVTPAASTP